MAAEDPTTLRTPRDVDEAREILARAFKVPADKVAEHLQLDAKAFDGIVRRAVAASSDQRGPFLFHWARVLVSTARQQRDPSADTAERSAIQNEASKVLALINGGGAAALATLLQAVWGKWGPVPRGMLITGIMFLLCGLAVVPVTFVLRYINRLTKRSYKPFRNPLWYVINLTHAVSLALFLWGMWWAVDGARLANGQ
jgi:hypothetical protein